MGRSCLARADNHAGCRRTQARRSCAQPGDGRRPQGLVEPHGGAEESDSALKKLFARRAPSWSPEADAKRSEMRRIVTGFLDFESWRDDRSRDIGMAFRPNSERIS